MEENSRCVICNVKGRSGKSFLCEDCGHPDKVYLACDGCRTIEEIEVEKLQLLRMALKLDFPLKKGITVKLSSCPVCDPKGRNKVFASLYVIQAP